MKKSELALSDKKGFEAHIVNSRGRGSEQSGEGRQQSEQWKPFCRDKLLCDREEKKYIGTVVHFLLRQIIVQQRRKKTTYKDGGTFFVKTNYCATEAKNYKGMVVQHCVPSPNCETQRFTDEKLSSTILPCRCRRPALVTSPLIFHVRPYKL